MKVFYSSIKEHSIHGNYRAGGGNKHNNDQSANQAAAGQLVGDKDS